MSFPTRIAFTAIAVITLDVLQSLTSRVFLVDYMNVGWSSYFIYFAAGFWGAHGRTFKWGVLLATVAGITDATIGWFVLAMIPPFTRTGIPPWHPLLLLIADVLILARAVFSGLFGAGFCALIGQTRPRDA